MESVSAEDSEKVTPSEIEKLKLNCKVFQESGVVPATISVVLPTFNTGISEYNNVLTNILKEISQLIDAGAIDELVIVDGSRDADGKPDFDFIKFMLAVCAKYCQTLHSEINFVRSLPDGKQKTLEGRFDFSVRFLSQLDPLLHKIFLDHELLTEDEVEFLKKGKGAGLWYAIPVTYGDILCFVDSDIRSFKDFYITSLCKPILETWNSDLETHTSEPDIVFTKAVYIRKNDAKEGATFGGRLSRLAAKPLFRILADEGVFKGLDEIKYHLSGECAFAIDTLKTIHFSNGYDIETSILCQLWREFGLDRVAQVDLGIYQHIPGSETHVKNMLKEVVSALKYWMEKYNLDDFEVGDMIKEYDKAAHSALDEYWNQALNMEDFDYNSNDRMADAKRIDEFKKILESKWVNPDKPKLLHAWKELEDKANSEPNYSYQNLKVTLRKRINKFTSNIILSSIYIDRSDDIIHKYTTAGLH